MFVHRDELTPLTNYAKGCRCEVCRAANADSAARYRERKRHRRSLVGGRWVATNLPVSWHGDAVAAVLYECECAPCCAASGDQEYADRMVVKARKTVRSQKRWARRASRMWVNGRWVAPLTVEHHGRPVAYRDWACECERCLGAKRGLPDVD